MCGDEHVDVHAPQTSLITVAASRTAQYVALYRALETVESRRAPLFQDPLAVRFLSPGLARMVRVARWPAAQAVITRYADYRAPGARTSAIGRTKIIDDVVRDAVAGGTGQLVILGAGFDCRAHRLPELAGVEVYEVDKPETQTEKRDRLPDARDDIRYVPVDFLRDDVAEELARAGWNRAEPTCFLWEGVTNYLTREAVEHMLDWIGATAPKSTLVFTYIHGGLLDGTVSFAGGAKMIGNVRALGEPWTFGLHPREVEPLLDRSGLTLREDLGADDYRRRTGLTHAPGYAFYRLAIAEVR
jgi:methyltransferase (TIGR00027 family)